MTSTEESLVVRDSGIYNNQFRLEQSRANWSKLISKDAQEADYSEQSILWLLYIVCCSALSCVGCESYGTILDITENAKIARFTEAVKNQGMLKVAQEFAKDIQNLHPLSKL